MAEETPGQKMAKNAKRLYDEGIETTKSWHSKLVWPENRPKGAANANDHKRGCVSPLGGDGWWTHGS